MDWNAQIGRELRGLDGIVAILFSLAGLAERAVGAPYPVRCAVFWFIRQAHMVAEEFVAGSACSAARAKWLAARMNVRDGSNSVGETDFAASLSSLACAVAAMVTQLRSQAFLHGGRSGDRSPGTHQHGIPGAFKMAASQAGRPDTS